MYAAIKTSPDVMIIKSIPELSDVWSLDEMYLNVKNTKKTGKGFHDWLWSIIDPKTRFLIATEVSKKREISDARKIIASGKKIVSQNPNYVLTDCLNSYQEAIRKEFQNKAAHIKTKSLKEGFVNRSIERYHNEIREKLKSRRGLDNDKSAQTFSELLRINHNFVKPKKVQKDFMCGVLAHSDDLFDIFLNMRVCNYSCKRFSSYLG